ncbi:glycine-rich RNA-binding protein GRP1A-like [Homarus americanus]|uniref:glycine-rich RNA-binding protein GRP1A-like n=1 Tax=Homarus americanus TaxID=6706 RepID=UPI001C43D025|nr:glycine-rich RNA-binding protein GRP1A-like [Homarus americanus]
MTKFVFMAVLALVVLAMAHAAPGYVGGIGSGFGGYGGGFGFSGYGGGYNGVGYAGSVGSHYGGGVARGGYGGGYGGSCS